MRRHGPPRIESLTLGPARRQTALMLAAVLAITLMLAPAPDRVAAQGLPPLPTLELATACGPAADDVGRQLTITLRGYNMPPSSTIDIFFDTRSDAPQSQQVESDQYGYFQQPLTFFQGAGGLFEIRAWHYGAFDDIGDLLATTYYYAPCPPEITAKPPCAEPADPADPRRTLDITIEGRNFNVFRVPVQLTLSGAGGVIGEPVTAKSDSATRTISGVLHVPALPAGNYTIEASQGVFGSTVIDFPVPCPVTEIRLSPTCGEPGQPPDRYGVIVSGSGFRENEGLEIIFDALGSAERFLYDVDLPPPGFFQEVLIEPFRRLAGEYTIIARQTDFLNRVKRAATATFSVPCPPQPVPSVTIDPPGCGPPQFLGDQQRFHDITVRGFEFDPGTALVVFGALGEAGFSAELFEAKVELDGTFVRPIDPLARPSGTYEIHIVQEKADGTTTALQSLFTVPCAPASPTFALDPTCGRSAAGQPQAYQIQATGTGYIPGYVEIIFDADGTPEAGSTFAGPGGEIQHTLLPTGRGPGTYRIVARQRDAIGTLGEASATLTVPCITPQLRITPASGAPGFVVVVEGESFEPNEAIILRWSRGISAGIPIELIVEPDGTFSRQVLIFHRDFLGPRQMTAELPSDQAAFPDATADYLVVAGRGSPPAFVVEGAEGPIVIRR